MTTATATGVKDTITVNLHTGSTLRHLANLHRDSFATIIELVQNLLDARAKHARILIDAKRRLIIAVDDGNGASVREMRQKFSQIGKSLKDGDAESFGKKGIGGLSAYVASELWEFTTRDKTDPSDPYRKYSLNADQFEKSEGIQVELEELDRDMCLGENLLGTVATTQVVLSKVDPSVITQLLAGREELAHAIQTSFNDGLKRLGIELVIDYRSVDGVKERQEIKPREFRGVQQEPVSIETAFGAVRFGLYLNPKPLRDPVIRIRYRDPVDQKSYGLPVSAITTGRTKTSPEAKQFLEKGYFEGTIAVEFGTMLPDRSGFVDNASYKAFVATVDDFVLKTLRATIEDLESEKHDDRLREIGDHILGKLRSYLGKDQRLSEIVRGKLSTLVSALGNDDGDPASWVPLAKKRKAADPSVPQKDAVRKAHEVDKDSEKRTGRKVMPNAGLGIVFVYPPDEDSFNWKYRIRAGVLEFNCADDNFVRCSNQPAKSVLEEYCLTMTLAAVSELATPAPMNSRNEKFLDLWVGLRLQ